MTRRLLRLRRIAVRMWKQWLTWTDRSGQIYFPDRVAEYREIWRGAANALGGTFTPLANDLWEIAVGPAVTRVQNHQAEFDDPVILALAGRKAVVHRLLSSAGLPVPEHLVFALDGLDKASRFLSEHPRGCVVKPAGGHGGQGVTTHVQSTKELRRAAVLASLFDSELLIEDQIPGESYRLLVLDGELIHAVCRRGPRARADGVSTVRRLIEQENNGRLRLGQPELDIDRDCLFTLGYQNLSLDAVPPAGTSFLVKSVNDPARKYAEVRTVYTDPVTDSVCESIRQAAEQAARIVGSDFLGVDVITTDATLPLGHTGGVVNEVNTTPALHHHYDSSREPFPPAAVRVLKSALARKPVESVHRV